MIQPVLIKLSILSIQPEPFEYLCERSDRGPEPESYAHSSFCLVCPFCLSVWCTVCLGSDARFTPHEASCESCGKELPHHPVAGSILSSWQNSARDQLFDSELLKALPESLVRREYNLHIQHYLGNL